MRVVELAVSAAFHTELVAHAQQPFAAFIDQQQFQQPNLPVFANSTAKAYPNDTNSIKEQLKNHILNPVYFKQQIENIHAEGGRIFVEFGPKSILSNLVKKILKGKQHEAIALNPSDKKDSDLQFRQAIVQLQVLGLSLNNIDPYQVNSKAPIAKTKMTLGIGGHNYVSKPTQKAYYETLNDGFQVKSGTTTLVEKEVEVIKEVIVEKVVEKIVEIPAEQQTINSSNQEEEEAMNKEFIETLKNTVEHITAQQTKSLEIFQSFLNEQNKQSQMLLQMMAQQVQLQSNSIASTSLASAEPEQIEAPVHVKETLVQKQAPIITPVAVPKEQTTHSVVTNNTAVASSNTISNDKMQEILLTVISEKTGYPVEMLELDMDMEADLGIDSIKRVEIFGSMTEDYPEVSGVNPNDLGELRTLGQIVDYLNDKAQAKKKILA